MTQPHITLLDPNEYPTEATAMLQALYSRSTSSVDEHISGKTSEELGEKMKQFYVGYGHKSIGDCASTTLFIEGVSILAAKVIQDTFSYKGQECSTRYIPFQETGFYTPDNLPEKLKGTQDQLIALYQRVYDETFAHLKETKPCPDDVKEKVWVKTLSTRAFDIARGWLPAGAKTNLSWHSDLRQIADRLDLLLHHPLDEVKQIAEMIKAKCLEAYPNSFKEKEYAETSDFYKKYAMNYAYSELSLQELSGSLDFRDMAKENEIVFIDSILPATDTMLEIASTRPERVLLPRSFDGLGLIDIAFPLDFASFRDIQRQRSAFIPNVILMPYAGMHTWYTGNLPASVRSIISVETAAIQNRIIDEIKAETITELEAQYLVPMGFKVLCFMQANMRALTYILELRSSRHVHQTLRDVINVISQRIRTTFGSYNLYLDDHPDELDSRRGEQDIINKEEADWDEFNANLEKMPDRQPDIQLDFKIGEGGKLQDVNIIDGK